MDDASNSNNVPFLCWNLTALVSESERESVLHCSHLLQLHENIQTASCLTSDFLSYPHPESKHIMGIKFPPFTQPNIVPKLLHPTEVVSQVLWKYDKSSPHMTCVLNPIHLWMSCDRFVRETCWNLMLLFTDNLPLQRAVNHCHWIYTQKLIRP